MEFTYYNEKLIGQLEYGFLPISPNTEMGYRPMELFVSSLTGCSTSVLANILVKKRIDYKRIDIEVTAVRNAKEANRIERLTFNVAVQTDTEDKTSQADKIAGLVLKNCGMIQSVIGSIDIQYQIAFTPDQPKKGDVA
ncbi:OsmC family protein [Mesobacillus subterraneus]|uniref:OsmC family protein n=1 Tax=Mesobacillus subterraneus TaxID=285983 RepID=UPI00203BA2E9|nr:OsmC family protein [Mesobacillus subterraneus]MCM3574361.1 OsmC family protein [Mesobacillus subterraneus]